MRHSILPSLFCPMASVRLFHIATCLQVGTMSLDWLVDPFASSEFSRSSLPPEVPSGEQQRGAFPASERSRWRQDALQAPPQILQQTKGWNGCGPFLSEGMRCITWNTRGLVGSVFSRQRNREFKLKFLKRLFDANNIFMSPRSAWKGRVSSGYSGVGSAISILWYLYSW